MLRVINNNDFSINLNIYLFAYFKFSKNIFYYNKDAKTYKKIKI